MINIFDVVEPMPNSNTTLEGENRFLGRDNGNSAFLIRVDNGFETGPYKFPFSQLIEELHNGLIYVIKNHTISGFVVSENQLKHSGKAQFKQNLEILSPVFMDEKMIFDQLYRTQQVEQLSEKLNKSMRSVRRLYYRFLGSGMNKFALAPMYHSRGGPQKSHVRRGPKNPNNTVALVVVESKLRDGVQEFLPSGKYTIETAYVKTLKKHFCKGTEFVDCNGKAIPLDTILRKNPNSPTLRQFQYVYTKMCNEGFKRKKHPRHAREYVEQKPLRGTARDSVRGPGHLFEIDSTGMQIQIVSRFGRAKLLGSATLYFVIDVFSGTIVGYVLSLHSAGWALAAKALLNCFLDKERIFRRLNRPYTSADWPCHHLPSRLAADRGEMKNIKPEILCHPAGINFEISPPMFPTWKGTVESAFNNMKHGDFYRIAGRHPKFPKRRESDGKDSAALTLEELEIIIVEKIMDINNDSAPEEIIPAEMMENANARPTRIELYKWGLENRPGYTRTLPEKDVFTLLLTRAQASVTDSGILFNGFTYVSDRLHENGFLQRAATRGHFKIEVAHDEHFADVVWFYDPLLDDWVEAENSNEEIVRKKISLYETQIFKRDLRKRLKATHMENIHSCDEKAKEINKLVRNAEKEAAVAKRGKTKTAQKKRILKNRAEEIRYIDELESAATIISYGYSINAARKNNRKTFTKALQPEPETPRPEKTSISELTKQIWKK